MTRRERRATINAVEDFYDYNWKMTSANINDSKASFAVLQTSHKLQAAAMRLAPGKSSGPKGNEHPDSEQLLFIVEGEVLAEIGQERALLRRGDFVIVPRGVAHRFTNHAASDAVTFNVYAPPAYSPGEGR